MEQNKQNWIKKQHLKYNVDKLGKLSHATTMLYEAESCYLYELNYAAIFCIHAAINSYLMQTLNETPKINGKSVRIASLRKLLNKIDYISNGLKDEIVKFSEVRGNLEHPKNHLETLFADWEFEIEDNNHKSPNLRSKSDDKLNEGIWFNPEKFAKKGLSLYYDMCGQIYNYLTKPTKK